MWGILCYNYYPFKTQNALPLRRTYSQTYIQNYIQSTKDKVFSNYNITKGLI